MSRELRVWGQTLQVRHSRRSESSSISKVKAGAGAGSFGGRARDLRTAGRRWRRCRPTLGAEELLVAEDRRMTELLKDAPRTGHLSIRFSVFKASSYIAFDHLPVENWRWR